MTTDSEVLHEIANTTNHDLEADIVFVHGLGGASHATWRHGQEGKDGHFFWPEELGKDLPHCGIWTVGYPAGFTALGKPGMIIEKRAGNLAQKLTNAGLGVRPLLFITHSMGGLVVKSLIVGSQTLADADRKRLVSMIRGIVFCATPHRGSAFADAAGVLGQFLGGSQDHVNEMRANAEPLDILHDQFIEWHRTHPIPIDSYAENVGLFRTRSFFRPLPLGLVVPRASANPGLAGHTVRDVDDDHLTLVKPSSRKHDVYAGVLRFIGDALTAISSEGDEATPAAQPPFAASASPAVPTITAGGRQPESANKPTQTAADYFNHGLRSLSGEDYDAALDALDQAIRLDPALVYAFYNRGLAHYLKGDQDPAIADFNRAFELGFGDAILFRNRGNAFSSKGDVARALADYAQAIALEPENALAYLNRGQVYENTLQKNPAIADYKTVLSLVSEPQHQELARQRLLAMGVRPAPSLPSAALVIWQKKLAFLQTEEAKSADAEQKFSIQQRIEEALAKIQELGG